ncbi:DUF6152 family protein [Hydrogenophaga sp. UC242_50]|uniref:DUF6152 family protein n=1 Tax=Hydrogenophaga sp. UC242_50 TaxID=3350169 RepID=UPI0036D3C9E9
MQRRDVIRTGAWLGLGGWGGGALAHHGWSSFDQDRPLYLEGRVVEVKWRNPHAELVLELPEALRLPADLGQRPLPAQTAGIDGPALLRQDRVAHAPRPALGDRTGAAVPVGAMADA